ncbi:MAG TPA: apolipoprotein N-acyltransferase [Actinomycetota bacterium]|nr:apolipoprotein N-acyltransferase [Actinomycetota bacterium]
MAAAAASGGLLSLANPPPDLGFVAFFAMVPLLWAARLASPRRAALFGLTFGLIYYGILLYWLLPFGVIAWLPVVLRETAFAALFAWLLPVLWNERRLVPSALLAAALWTAVDWMRGAWPIGGFTWGGLGYTQHDNPFLLPLASVAGVWGVTFVVSAVNALVFGAVRSVGRTRVRAATMAGTAAALVLAPSLISLPAATGPAVDTAIVQGNVPLELAHDRFLQSRSVGENHITLHRELRGNPPDLAVWPENALDEDPARNKALGRRVASAIRSVDAQALVGAITEGPGNKFFNQTLLYAENGSIVGRYTKTHLVPFGEYIPFRAVLGWTNRFRRTARELTPGDTLRLFDVAGVRLGAPICFENAYPDLFRRFVARGANLMVVSTNDSSFLRTVASREHVMMSQLRAVETGRWIVHAAISGHSAFVNPEGHVVARTPLFTRTILRREVPTSTVRTVYVRFGDWLPLASAVAALVGVGLGARRRMRPRRATPPGAEDESTEAGPIPAPIAGGGEPRVLVVLPTYNEKDTIRRVLDGVLAVGENIHVLVIDDGSPDGTGDDVARVADNEPRVRLLRRPGKQGLASAYLTGFRIGVEEGYDVVVEMDADLSHRPEDLPRILEALASYDVVIGSRYVPGGEVTNWSRTRVALSKGGNAYARGMLRFPIADSTSGFRAYRRHVLESFLTDGITSEGYAFQIELAYRAWRSGFSVGEVPIRFREREHGRSKLSRRIVAEALWRVGTWGLRDRFAKRPVARSGGSPSPFSKSL